MSIFNLVIITINIFSSLIYEQFLFNDIYEDKKKK